MAQNVGQSRGSQKHKQFVQDSANSYIVDAFKDMAETAPLSPVDGEGYVVENVGSIDLSWGTITGLANGDIIRWRQSKLAWQIVMKAVVANQGFKAFVKDEDTLYVLDAGAEWIIASGSGGGVKNFAQKQASAYKPGDWIQGNSGLFGASGTLAGTLDREQVAPLDGKKSFKYTTAAGSGNDWFYLLVDIDQYARGGVIAFTFDYQWDGDEDIQVQIWDPTFTNQYSTELNLVKNTTNDNKLSRNSRTIYAHPNTESQVVVGFQIASTESTGKNFIFDNLKVTDDIGIIGSGSTDLIIEQYSVKIATNNSAANSVYDTFRDTLNRLVRYDGITDNRHFFTVLEDCNINIGGSNEDANNLAGFYVYINGIVESGGVGVVTANRPVIGGSWNGRLIAGDEFFIQIDNQSNTFAFINILAQAQIETDSRFLQVPNGEKLRDTFAVSFDAEAATPNVDRILSTNYDWVDSVAAFGPTGAFDINIKPGIFSVPPIVTATNNGSVLDDVRVTSVSTSQIGLQLTVPSGNGGWGGNIDVIAHKAGADVAPDIVGVPVSIQGQTHEEDSMIRFAGTPITLNGQMIQWGASPVENKGNAIVDNDGFGRQFKVKETGTYTISTQVHLEQLGQAVYIMKNSTSTSSIGSNTLTWGYAQNSGGYDVNLSWTGILVKEDLIGILATSTLTAQNYHRLTITKIGTQPLIDGGQIVESEAIGSIIASGSISTPENYLPCDGTAISRTEYKELFNAIGESFGAGNGSTTFNLPDLRGQFLRGWSEDASADPDGPRDPGDSQSDAFQGHRHGEAYSGAVIGGRYGNVTVEAGAAVSRYSHSDSGAANTSVSALTSIPYQDGTNGTPRTSSETRPKNVAVKYFIRYKSKFQVAPTRVYTNDPIAWQRKSGSTASNGIFNAISFNNLEPGKTYKIQGYCFFDGASANDTQSFFANIENNGTAINQAAIGMVLGFSPDRRNSTGFTEIFTATGTTLDFRVTDIYNVTTLNISWILEELPWHSQTSKWT